MTITEALVGKIPPLMDNELTVTRNGKFVMWTVFLDLGAAPKPLERWEDKLREAFGNKAVDVAIAFDGDINQPEPEAVRGHDRRGSEA